MKWGIKRISQRRPAAEVRRRDRAAGRAARPDAPRPGRCKWNAERGHYDFGAIDWDEFWRVVNGDGPCNRERLAHRACAPTRTAGGCARPRSPTRRSSARAANHAEQARVSDRTADGHERPSGRSGKSSSAPSRGSTTSTAAACTRPTRSMALRMARDVYTRRQEGVSHLGRPVERDHRVGDPDEKDDDVRSDGRQDLPAPDVLRAARRSQAHVTDRPGAPHPRRRCPTAPAHLPRPTC